MTLPGAVTAVDVRLATDLAIATLEPVTGRDWQVPASGLTWTVRETVEHMADDLLAYAGQVAARRPALTAYIPFGCRRRPDDPAPTLYAQPDAGAAGLLFPEAPADGWAALLRATGRAGLPGRPRRREWRWFAEPRERVR